jgi:hypothetical protein
MKSIPPLHDLRLFWASRRALLDFSFKLRRVVYVLQEKVGTGRQATSIILALVGNVWQVGLISVLLVVVLQLGGDAFHKNLSLVFGNLPRWSVQLLQFLVDIVHLDKDATRQLLATVASVAGVFLGLYFTAISVIAGALFVNVPSVVREQLVREKAGALYFKGLAMLTSTSVLLLGYQAIGGTPNELNLLLILVLSLFCVLSFLLLSTRVFYFFDYSELARPIFTDLQREIRKATTRGFAWDDGTFQSHYQKNASQQLDTLRTFVQTVLSTIEKEEEPLIKLAQRLGYALFDYQKEKRRIPTNSKWFESTPIHRNWFLAESTELSVAMSTYVGIQPKLQPNLYWFEDKACQILQLALSEALAHGRMQATYRILQPISIFLKNCGKEFAFEEASRVIDLIRDQVVALTKNLDSRDANRILSSDFKLGIVDCHGYAILNFVIGFFEGVSANELSSIKKKLNGVSWGNPKSIYDRDFLSPILGQLEFVQRTLVFEQSVDGKSTSPTWYRDQLVILQYVRLLSAGLGKTVELIGSEFVDISKTYVASGQSVYAAMHATRGLEACEKIRFHLGKDKSLIESFEGIRIMRELPWPKWDWDKLQGDLQSKRESLIEVLANCLPMLAILDRPQAAPDFFGQSYTSVYQHAMFLLQRNRADEFARIFPKLFVGVMAAHDRLQKEQELIGADVKAKIVFGSEPIIDILDLSGYAKIYSELYLNPKIWEVCGGTWNRYFDENKNASELAKFFVGVYQYRSSLFSLIPRDILRTNWQLQLNQILREEDLVDDFGYRGAYDEDPPLEHWRPFIRAFCRNRHEPFESAVEVFLLLYVMGRPEAKGVTFKGHHDLLDHIEEESRRQRRIGDAKGSEQ